MRLFRSEMPVGAPSASRSTSNTENGRRSSGSCPRPALTITNCPGAAAAAIAGAASASDVVVGRQPRVRRSPPPRCRRASRQYTPARALPSDAQQLDRRRDAGDVLRPDRPPAAQSAPAARSARASCRSSQSVGLFYVVHLIGRVLRRCSWRGSCWRASCSRRRGSASACCRGWARVGRGRCRR